MIILLLHKTTKSTYILFTLGLGMSPLNRDVDQRQHYFCLKM